MLQIYLSFRDFFHSPTYSWTVPLKYSPIFAYASSGRLAREIRRDHFGASNPRVVGTKLGQGNILGSGASLDISLAEDTIKENLRPVAGAPNLALRPLSPPGAGDSPEPVPLS